MLPVVALVLIFVFAAMALIFFRANLGRYHSVAGIDKSELKDITTLFGASKFEAKRIFNELKTEKLQEPMFKSASFTGANLRMRLFTLQSSLDYLQKNAAANPLRVKAFSATLAPLVNYNIVLAKALKQVEDAEEYSEKQEIKEIQKNEKANKNDVDLTNKLDDLNKKEEQKDKKSAKMLDSEKRQQQEAVKLETIGTYEKTTDKKLENEEKDKLAITKKDKKSMDKIISILEKTRKLMKQEKWDAAYSNSSEAIKILDETRGDELRKFRETGIESLDINQELSFNHIKNELAKDIALKIVDRIKQRKK